MAALNDFNSLLAAVQAWLVRSDPDIVANAPIFVALAEARINRDLRIRAQESTQVMQTSPGSNLVPLPAGYLQSRRLTISESPQAVLNYLTPEIFYTKYDPTQTGDPVNHTIEGNNLVLGPTPDQAYTLSMQMYSAFPSLSVANPVNWLIQNYPDIYLFSTLCEAELFLMNDARSARWEQRYQLACGQAQAADRRDRFSGAALRMNSDSGIY